MSTMIFRGKVFEFKWMNIKIDFFSQIYAATVVLWRVYTFNDCEDAAKELKEVSCIKKKKIEYILY